MADLNTKIKLAVEQAIVTKQNETLEASKIIAETIATKILEKQENSLTKCTEILDGIEDQQSKASISILRAVREDNQAS